VSVLEEREDIPSSEQVFVILYHFETKLNQDDEPSTREATFKSISKDEEASTLKQKGKTHSSNNPDDKELQNFLARNLPRGSGKYKGKLPLKCFSCGKIGHYAKICPYTKNVENEDENDSRNFRNRKFRNKFHKNFFLAKECDSSDENDSSVDDSISESDNDSELEKLMFMDMDSTSSPESISEDEGDVSKQLNNALEELGSVRSKYKVLKEVNKDLVQEK